MADKQTHLDEDSQDSQVVQGNEDNVASNMESP